VSPRPGNVTLPVARFEELLEAARRKPPDPPRPEIPPPVDVAIDSLAAAVSVAGDHAEVHLDVVIRVLAEEWVTVPLLAASTGVSKVSVDGAARALSEQGGHHVLHLKGRGDHRVAIDLRTPVETLVGGRRLRFSVPAAVAQSLVATLPGEGWDVHVLPSTGLVIEARGGQTQVDATLPSTDVVQVLWGTRRPASAAFARAAYALEVVGEGVFGEVDFEIDVRSDEPREVALLPSRYALREVTVDGGQGRVTLAGDHHAVTLQGQGPRRVHASFALNVDRAGGQPAVELDVPVAPIARFDLSIPGKRDIAVDPPVPLVVESDEKLTRVVANFPATAHVRFGWTDSRPVPEQNIRMNGDGWYAVSAEEGGLRVASHFAFDVISGKAREIGFVVPESVVIYQVTGDGVADWRTFTDDESGQRRLQVYLDRPRHGAYELDVSYDSLVRQDDPARAAGVPIPLVQPSPVHRYQGVVLLLAGTTLDFDPLDTSGYSSVGEESLPQEVRSRLAGKVAHGFKHVGEAPPLVARLVAPVKEPARFDVATTTLITLDEGALRGQATADVTIKSGTLRELVFRLDPTTTVLDVAAPALLRFAESGAGDLRRVTATFTEELAGTVRVGLSFERILDPEVARVALVPIAVEGADVQHGFVALESPAAVEVEGLPGDSIHPVGVDELPRALTSATGNPILLAYRFSHLPYELAVAVTRHQSLTPQDSIIATARLGTALRLQGNLVTTAEYLVRNRTRQFLRVELPSGAELREVSVAGETVRPALDESGRLIVPLPRSPSAVGVELAYTQSRSPLGILGHVRLVGPRPDLHVDDLRWSIELPDGYGWRRAWTNVGRPPLPSDGRAFELARQLVAPDDDPPAFAASYLRRADGRGLNALALLVGLGLGALLWRARRAPSPAERGATLGLAVAGVALVLWLGASPWTLLAPLLALALGTYVGRTPSAAA
jgi:hypothetical protein